MAMDKEREALVARLMNMRDSLDRHAQHIYADICRDAIAALTAQEEPVEGVHIIFDGPPSHESGRFVEVETPDGRSISWGRWEQRGKYWHLIAPQPVDGVVVPRNIIYGDTLPVGRQSVSIMFISPADRDRWLAAAKEQK